jgi:hypothetical protein
MNTEQGISNDEVSAIPKKRKTYFNIGHFLCSKWALIKDDLDLIQIEMHASSHDGANGC